MPVRDRASARVSMRASAIKDPHLRPRPRRCCQLSTAHIHCIALHACIIQWPGPDCPRGRCRLPITNTSGSSPWALPCTLHPAPCTLHPASYTSGSSPWALPCSFALLTQRSWGRDTPPQLSTSLFLMSNPNPNPNPNSNPNPNLRSSTRVSFSCLALTLTLTLTLTSAGQHRSLSHV